MLRCTLIAAICLGGCYSPSPPAGAYLCGPDDACPSGQHCKCGQCVNQDSQAACSFDISFPGVTGAPLVAEHQKFPVALQALASDGTPASGFAGTVKLASSWGDVNPAQVTLAGGAVTATIALNRETLPPAVAKLTASYAAGTTSTSTGINVLAAPFTVAPTEITVPFGWATRFVAEPSISKVGSGYRMYFIGSNLANEGIGVATSPDGVTWTAAAQPLITASGSGLLLSPSVYAVGSESEMAYSELGNTIPRATSTDGLQPFMPQAMPLLGINQCSYCSGGVTFPQVMPDLLAGAPDGGMPPWLMFFSSFSAADGSVSIGRASSTDGFSFTPEPAPVLQGNLSGEAVLLSPRVLLDGTVYKMWYSVASIGEISLQVCGPLTPCTGNLTCDMNRHVCVSPTTDAFSSFCEAGTTINVGYATSSDGFFWTRSELNPVLKVKDASPNDHALLVSAVVPTDGSDPASGITLYYSAFRRMLSSSNACVPNGIAHATRP